MTFKIRVKTCNIYRYKINLKKKPVCTVDQTSKQSVNFKFCQSCRSSACLLLMFTSDLDIIALFTCVRFREN